MHGDRRGLADEDWASLVLSIRSGNCVLMLGPGAVDLQRDGARLPVLDGLARHLASKLADDGLAGSRLAVVGQAVRARKDPNTLLYWTAEFFQDVDVAADDLVALAGLPFPIVVNAVPGAPVEQAFAAAGKSPLVAHYDYTAGSAAATPTGSADQPLIYHLLGSADSPSSLVVSESALLDFLVAAVSANPALPSNLTSVLRGKRTTFLFLGFQLYQWHLRILVHGMFMTAGRDNRSFALEAFDPDDDHPTGSFYWQDCKVDFFDADVAAFVGDLVERVGPVEVGGTAAAPGEPAPDAPEVFICHASEDKPSATQLAADLRSRGIRVWIDEDELRGGDRWDESIQQVITKDVDYFVVLQTAQLKAKDVGYVNKEINLALSRHLEYRPPRVFMIPAVLGGPPARLEHLEHIQSIALDEWVEGVDELASTIRRDVARARR